MERVEFIFGKRTQHFIDLIRVLTQKEIKVKYKSSFLGYMWSVAHPLAFAFVFFIAFKVIMRIQMENYTLFLIAGLFPWQWFANSITTSSLVFLGNASIIKKVNFSRNTLVAAAVLNDMTHFVLSIPVFVLFMFIYGKHPSWVWFVGIPVMLVVQYLFSYGVALFVASVNLFFRDLERLVTILVTMLFYFTPIIYPETMIPEGYRHLLSYNPIAPLIISWRQILLNGSLDGQAMSLALLYGVILFGVGTWVYRKLSWKFAEVL